MTKPIPKNILIIGDTHEPFCKKGYLDFCKKTRDKYECDTIVHIGDEVDHHALGKHIHDSDGFSAGDEYKEAYKKMQSWFKTFPKVKICIGNHSCRHFRQAKEIGIPFAYMKTYRDIWDAPDGWKWEYDFTINNILFTHGTGKSGLYPHANLAKQNRQSTVMGHVHAIAGVEWFASKKDIIFGMAVGSGMDTNNYAASYAEIYTSKPIISCGVILNRGKLPMIIKMDLK
jgi:predicted phosphodiesterase